MSVVDSTLHVPKPSRAAAYIDVLQKRLKVMDSTAVPAS